MQGRTFLDLHMARYVRRAGSELYRVGAAVAQLVEGVGADVHRLRALFFDASAGGFEVARLHHADLAIATIPLQLQVWGGLFGLGLGWVEVRVVGWGPSCKPWFTTVFVSGLHAGAGSSALHACYLSMRHHPAACRCCLKPATQIE